MQLTLKKWGNSTGILFSKEFLRRAGVTTGDKLEAEIIEGKIILTPCIRHQDLRERAAYFGGKLDLSDEIEREEPEGNEVW